MRTGQASVIGTSLKLFGVRKDSSLQTIWVTVSEHKDGDVHGFIGTIHEDQQGRVDSRGPSRDQARTSSKAKRTQVQEEYHVLDNFVEAALVTDHNGCVVYANNAIEDLIEFRKGELVGKSVKGLLPPAYIEKDEYARDYVHTGGSKMVGRPLNMLFQSKSGMVVPVSLSVSKKTLCCHDTTERRRKRTLQIRAAERKRSNWPFGFAWNDENCIVQGFNNAAAKVLGFSSMEVLGRKVTMLIPEGHTKNNHNSYVRRYID